MQLHRFDNVLTLPPLPKYPDTLSVAAPRGMRIEAQRAAAAAGVTTANFLRTAIAEHIRRTLDEGVAAHG